MPEISFQEADHQIRSIAKIEAGRNRRNMGLGWWGYRLKAANKWQQNGFADEAAYRDAVGVSNNVWSRYIRIASAFEDLELARFVLMTAENAEQLGSLPVEYRYAHSWLENAVKLKAEDFKREVLKVKADVAGVEVQDMRVKWSIQLFEKQRAAIKWGIATFQMDHGVQDEGTALEWLVMEYANRQTFVHFIQDQLPLLSMALRGGDPTNALGLHIVALHKMLDHLKGDRSQ